MSALRAFWVSCPATLYLEDDDEMSLPVRFGLDEVESVLAEENGAAMADEVRVDERTDSSYTGFGGLWYREELAAGVTAMRRR